MLKNATDVNVPNFAENGDLTSLKWDADDLDIDELVNVLSVCNSLRIKLDELDISNMKTAPIDLKKLSNAADENGIENSEYKKPELIGLELKFLVYLL